MRDRYRADLSAIPIEEWPTYLTEHSGLPGPRGNIELAEVCADLGDAATFDRLIATDDEYLVFCGVMGLGRLLAEGRAGIDVRLHRHAADDRWRVREAVAMALQRLGDADLPRLLALVTLWAADPDPLVQRAAVAGLCEPRLLVAEEARVAAVELCERVTSSLAARPAEVRRTPGVRTLRQGLGYCWSVAVAADPAYGLPRFLALGHSTDPDVAWIDRENRRKKRLARLL